MSDLSWFRLSKETHRLLLDFSPEMLNFGSILCIGEYILLQSVLRFSEWTQRNIVSKRLCLLYFGRSGVRMVKDMRIVEISDSCNHGIHRIVLQIARYKRSVAESGNFKESTVCFVRKEHIGNGGGRDRQTAGLDEIQNRGYHGFGKLEFGTEQNVLVFKHHPCIVALTKKLLTLTNKSGAEQLRQHFVTPPDKKPKNEQIYYIADTVSRAIMLKKKISFQYDMHVDHAAEMNRHLTTFDDVYYFSVPCNSTEETKDGIHRPIHRITDPFLVRRSIQIGCYSGTTKGGTDSWHENDGLVNTISARAPFGQPQQELNRNSIRTGIWNICPVFRGDHMSINGGLTKKTDMKEFYLDLLTMIDAL